jgi:protein-disulfide isomerase
MARLLFAFLLLLFAAPASAQTFNAQEQAEIRAVVREYLVNNPDVLREALDSLQARATAERVRRAERDPRDFSVGPRDAPITIVEFFDYRCPYCKSVAGSVVDLVETDGNIRFVLKEYPILGADSEFAAKAALAARMQGKYRELHMAMMDFKGKVTSDDVRRLAAGVGLDVDRLERDMQSPVVADSISRNLALGEAIGVRGTPAFVIGDELIPGAISVEEMQKRIAVARKTEG